MNNKLCVKGSRISLYYATIKDKKLVYDMSMTPGIKEFMYWGECKPEPWEKVKNEENEFYTGQPGKNNYLLIVKNNKIIGSISHSYNDTEIENMEIDIWLGSPEFIGKGYGSEAVLTIIDYLYKTYNIRTFIMRPGIKNTRAIRAYEKCGFQRVDHFDSQKYYGANDEEWCDGDYGIDSTVNMIKVI